MKYINLVNVSIKNKNIEFEFLYKNKYFNKNRAIYFEDELQRKYFCNIKQCNNEVNYSYNNETCYISKVMLNMPIAQYGKMKILLKENDKILELDIRDNKNELISERNNPYTIFLNKYKIKISLDNIQIIKRNFGDKIIYEIEKQIYGIKKYKRLFIFRFLKMKKRKYYLFNDRLLYGDDNSEQLFRYINENYPKFAKKCYFVLDKNSTSINRIRKIGKVLKYGSFNHKFKFLNSKMVISSHSSYLDNSFNPFSIQEMNMYKDIINKKFVFLPHGVIMNDVRQYLNRELITADLFITSTRQEYQYIMQEDFMYETDMVACTGLPRFDRLKNNKNSKIILISPTWRALGENMKFENSQYFKVYRSLLTNSKLKEILKKEGYKIKFLLHPVFAKYKDLFNDIDDKYIEILETSKIKYFELFNECDIFITDYSSIHFDVAYLKKPIIYYQFDKEYFFKKHYNKGYFDYEKHGFGKIVEKEEQLINEIQYYIQNNCQIKKEYKEKIENTFIYFDHNNSKRTFNRLIELDNRNNVDYRFNNIF